MIALDLFDGSRLDKVKIQRGRNSGVKSCSPKPSGMAHLTPK